MVSDIDQFGRDTTKNNNQRFNDEKSKKILDSLAEIKNQLENKDYNPNVDDSSPRIRVSDLKNKSDFDELKLKIESLEKKINTILFTGKDSGICGNYADLKFNVPSNNTARIQECHTLIGHSICKEVEIKLKID